MILCVMNIIWHCRNERCVSGVAHTHTHGVEVQYIVVQ